MKKLFCLFLVLLSTSFMFGATIWIPRIQVSRSGVGDMIKFEDVEKWNINPTSGVLHFVYKGKNYYSSVFVIEE